MNADSDLHLIQEFQNGHEQAFNQIVLRYQEKVYWVARRFLNDHAAADDVTQEVFIKAYDALKTFRGESGLYTWLYRITVNASLNVVRASKVRTFLRLDEVFDIADTKEATPTQAFEKREETALIEEAIASLPEKQKAVFLMRYYDELPYEEIAAILHTSVGGLKANYFHAVKKIGTYVRNAHRIL